MANSFLGMFRSGKLGDPLASVKAASAWVAGLPAKDPMGALETIVAVLEDMGTAQPEVTANRVLALMTLDRLSLPRQAEVLVQYRLPTMSEDVRRRLWHACNDLARWFAYAYEHVGGVAEAPGNRKRPRLAVHGIFSRMFYYRGLQAKLGLFHYENWIPGSWQFLHNAYREACAQGVESAPFALPESADPGDRYSAEQEFLQILLLQRINSGDLTAQQVEWAAQWLRLWVRTLKLGAPPAEGDGYWLDLSQGDGLTSKRSASPSGDLRYIDVQPLHAQLGALIARVGKQLAQGGGGAVPPASRALDEQLKLARRLEHLWRPQSQQRARRGERRPERRPVIVAAGWTSIMVALRLASVHRRHEPNQYTYGDATSLSVHGQQRNVQRDRFGSTVSSDLEQHGWQLRDTSESGARILSATKEALQQQIGALLALQPDGDTRWRIGIVRRLRRRTAGHTELGVEIIADQAVMMTAAARAVRESAASGDGVDTATRRLGFHVLYLPPQQHTRSTPVRSIVLPATEFVPGRRLSIQVEGTAQEIRLFAMLEQTKEWVWTAFDVPAKAQTT